MVRTSTLLCVVVLLALCLVFSPVEGKKKKKSAKKESKAPEKLPKDEAAEDDGTGGWQKEAHLRYGNNPLHDACLEGNTELVRKILDRVPGVFTDARFSAFEYDDPEDYPDHRDKNDAGNTPLLLAMFRGHKRIVEMLLDKGATVHHRNRAENLPIMWAARHQDPSLVQMLLDRGAVVNVADTHGFTPLHFCAHAGAVETCKLLLDRGAEVDAKTDKGYTPACSASEFHKPDVLKLLLERGADVVNTRDANGNGPMDLCSGRAASQGYSGKPHEMRTVEMLRDAGARYAEEGKPKKEL